jgi:glycosyltransferase involved in cell wall biosynthesis
LRIGLNLLHALPEIGGVWNYIENLVKALAEIDTTDSFVALVTAASERLVPSQANFEIVRLPINSASRALRVAYENTTVARLASRRRLDCLHWFSGTQAIVNAVPSAVTIYDLQSFMNLAPYPWFKRLYLKAMVRQTVKRARVLLPMSEATADELAGLFKVGRSRMTVIPPVLGMEYRPAPREEIERFRARHRLPERFWLYVAHYYPHKNHLRLLEAFERLKSRSPSGWHLVLRGDPKGAEKEVQKFVKARGLEKNVIFMLPLQTFELPLLYSAASALVFPSCYEGGGLPVIEAMACGLPVAGAKIPPVMEFAGPAASYFNPFDVGSIEQAMREFQENAGVLDGKRQAGLARAENFRPSQVIPRLRAAYARAVG